MRLRFGLPCVLLAVLAAFSVGCGVDVNFDPSAGGSGRQAQGPGASAARQGETIRVASFNIQVFGVSKIEKPHAMEPIVEIVRRFDVVAIQELRAADQTVVPQFVDMLNADGSQYAYIVGPRLGRTSSKEQYVYVYDTTRIELAPQSVYTVPDPNDLLHREPLVATFRVRGPAASQAFTFSLVNIHTDPDETDTELDALADVFESVQRNGSGEDDVILLGDLNVDEYHLGRLGQLPNIAHAIAGVPTNTRGNKSYDNIVFNRAATTEYLGQSGVLNFMAEFNLSLDQALDISDHFPVWATFSAYEGNAGPVAAGTAPRTR